MTSERLIDNTGEPQERTRVAAFSRTWTDTLAFPRAFTESALNMIDFESEEALLRKLIEDCKDVATKGPEGDVPIPEGFGRNPIFWKIALVCTLFGGIMGIAALGILNCSNEIPKLWVDNGNFDEAEDFEYYSGSTFWIIITTLMGFTVGTIRWYFQYPDNLPGFFKELNNAHVDPTYVPLTVTMSAICLAGGANLGPEACLGNFGGGLGTFVSERMNLGKNRY